MYCYNKNLNKKKFKASEISVNYYSGIFGDLSEFFKYF